MIVVTTPTGRIGSQILVRLLESRAGIRVLARDPGRLPAATRERVDVVQASMDDVEAVGRALDGADCVFWLVPPDPRATSVQSHILRFVGPLCEAIVRHDVGRVVAVSSLGRGVATAAGQISAIFAMDDLIESTGVAYRSLQPPGFMDNTLWQLPAITGQGTFFSTISADRRIPTCATRDIAAAAAGLLLDDSWAGQKGVPLLGAEDLSHQDMAAIMSEVLERPVGFQQIPEETYRASLTRGGMSAAWAQGLVDMAAAVQRGIYNHEPRTSASTTPTTFRQWCEEVLKPAALA